MAMDVTQYALSAEQQERILMISTATRIVNGVDGAIMCITVEKRRFIEIMYSHTKVSECLPPCMVASLLYAKLWGQRLPVMDQEG